MSQIPQASNGQASPSLYAAQASASTPSETIDGLPVGSFGAPFAGLPPPPTTQPTAPAPTSAPNKRVGLIERPNDGTLPILHGAAAVYAETRASKYSLPMSGFLRTVTSEQGSWAVAEGMAYYAWDHDSKAHKLDDKGQRILETPKVVYECPTLASAVAAVSTLEAVLEFEHKERIRRAQRRDDQAAVDDELELHKLRAVYFSMGGFEPGTLNKKAPGKDPKKQGRSRENVRWLRSLFLDLDCGPGKDYPDQDAAADALQAFRKLVGLPLPLVNSSGLGLHAYWPFARDVTRDEFEEIAAMLEAVRTHRIDGQVLLKADPVTTDPTRLLRPVGSLHRKTGENLEVHVLVTPKWMQSGQHLSPEDVKATLAKFIEAHDIKVERPRPIASRASAGNFLKGRVSIERLEDAAQFWSKAALEAHAKARKWKEIDAETGEVDLRKLWLKAVLRPLKGLAQADPKNEPRYKKVYEDVCDLLGGDTSKNEAQWSESNFKSDDAGLFLETCQFGGWGEFADPPATAGEVTYAIEQAQQKLGLRQEKEAKQKQAIEENAAVQATLQLGVYKAEGTWLSEQTGDTAPSTIKVMTQAASSGPQLHKIEKCAPFVTRQRVIEMLQAESPKAVVVGDATQFRRDYVVDPLKSQALKHPQAADELYRLCVKVIRSFDKGTDLYSDKQEDVAALDAEIETLWNTSTPDPDVDIALFFRVASSGKGGFDQAAYERALTKDWKARVVKRFNDVEGFIHTRLLRTAVLMFRDKTTGKWDHIPVRTFKDQYTTREPKDPNAKISREGPSEAEAYLASEDRNQRRAAGYFPYGPDEPEPENVVNLFYGSSIRILSDEEYETKKHLAKEVCDFIRDIGFSGKDDESYELFLDALEFKRTHPGKKPSWFVVLIGKEGAGKDFLTRDIVGAMYAKNYAHNGKAEDIVRGCKTNKHLSEAEVVLLQEGDLTKIADDVKAFVSSETWYWTDKFLVGQETLNPCWLFVSTNHEHPSKLSAYDRRTLVMYFSDKHLDDKEYYEGFKKRLDDGGLDAFYTYLHKHRRINQKFLTTRVPDSAARADQREKSLDPYQQTIKAFLVSGAAWDQFVGRDRPLMIPSDALYQILNTIGERHGLREPAGETKWSIEMSKAFTEGTATLGRLPRNYKLRAAKQALEADPKNTVAATVVKLTPENKDSQVRGWVLPALDGARASFDTEHRTRVPWRFHDGLESKIEMGDGLDAAGEGAD